MTDLHKKRLCDIETPICDAHLMSGVVSILVEKLAKSIGAYKHAPPTISGARMAEELDELADQVLFIAYRLQAMLGDLKFEYMAPIEESEPA